MTPYAIEVNDLTVAYQEHAVLWDIDLAVPQGVLMAIVGPNGAGKTTLLRKLCERLGDRAPEVDDKTPGVPRLRIELAVGRKIGLDADD